MNPTFPTPSDEQKEDTAVPAAADTQTTSPLEFDSSPEADAAALQAIEALEAEDSPVLDPSDTPVVPAGEQIAVKVTSTPQPVAATTTPPIAPAASVLAAADEVEPTLAPSPVAEPVSSTPFSAFGGNPSAPSSSPAISAALASSLKEDSAASPKGDPFGPKKKSKKGLIIALIVIIFVGGGGAAGYFVWQNMSATKTTTTETTQQGGDVPGEVEDEADTTPTPESVEADASTIESDLNSIDMTELNDTTINDASLLQN